MTNLKLDFSELASSDLDGLAGVFMPVAALERHPGAAQWGQQMLDAIAASREEDTVPHEISLDGLNDSELMFLAGVVTSVMDEGTLQLAEWGERVCIAIAGEMNRRGRGYQMN